MDPFYLALLLYVAALMLAFVDLFVPSGGMLMILAAVSGLACVLFSFRSSQAMGMVMLTVVLASIPIFAAVAIKIWPLTPIGRRIILKTPGLRDQEKTPQPTTTDPLIGAVLLVETPLMPTGHIRFGHKRYNAISQVGLIEAGQHVKVLALKERNYLVQPTDEPITDPASRTQTHAPAEQPREYTHEELLDTPADELGLESLEDS